MFWSSSEVNYDNQCYYRTCIISSHQDAVDDYIEHEWCLDVSGSMIVGALGAKTTKRAVCPSYGIYDIKALIWKDSAASSPCISLTLHYSIILLVKQMEK